MTEHHHSERVRAKLPLVSGLLHDMVRMGYLTLVDAAGRRHEFGEGSSDLRVTARLHDRRLPWKLAFSPSLALGEAYMDERLTIDGGRLREFLEIITPNLRALSGVAGKVAVACPAATWFGPCRGARIPAFSEARPIARAQRVIDGGYAAR